MQEALFRRVPKGAMAHFSFAGFLGGKFHAILGDLGSVFVFFYPSETFLRDSIIWLYRSHPPVIQITEHSTPPPLLPSNSRRDAVRNDRAKIRDYKLQGTAYDKRCQRRIYERSGARKPRKLFEPVNPFSVSHTSVSKDEEVYTLETSCMKRTFFHINKVDL